uniref:Uncharacterized protein n=1 Tax=Knipowitschia caucasica TaxID=637954 RepID=A0AAV2LXG3_KNICA
MAHIDTAVISKTVIVPRAHLWPPPPASSKGGQASGPRLGARPTPLRDPGPHNFNPGAGWSSLPGQLPDPFSYRDELDLPVPQRRNCAPTPTKRSTVDHRASSHLWASRDRSPLPAPVCGKDWSVCAPALRA